MFSVTRTSLFVSIFAMIFSVTAFANTLHYSWGQDKLSLDPQTHKAHITANCMNYQGQNIGTGSVFGKYQITGNHLKIWRPKGVIHGKYGSFRDPGLQVNFQKSHNGWKEVPPYPGYKNLNGWHGASCQFSLSGSDSSKKNVTFLPAK